MCVFVCGGISSHIKPLVKSGVLFSPYTKLLSFSMNNNSFVVRCLSFCSEKNPLSNAQLKKNQKRSKKNKKNNSRIETRQIRH